MRVQLTTIGNRSARPSLQGARRSKFRSAGGAGVSQREKRARGAEVPRETRKGGGTFPPGAKGRLGGLPGSTRAKAQNGVGASNIERVAVALAVALADDPPECHFVRSNCRRMSAGVIDVDRRTPTASVSAIASRLTLSNPDDDRCLGKPLGNGRISHKVSR